MKTSRITRVIRLLTALQSGQRYKADDLAQMLRIGQRTVFRDLKELQKAGVPCHYNKKTRGYAIDPKFFLPAPDLNIQEALGLLLLVYKARNHIHFPFKESALRAALKIENNLPRKIKRYCNAALRNIFIKADAQERLGLLDNIFGQLQEAILKKHIVKIRYYLAREHKSIVTDLSPYHLMHNEHTWYVLGKSSFHRAVRAFRLNRIKELNMLDKHFIEDSRFDVHKYLGRAWSMTSEGILYNVKLRFLPEVAYSVAEVQWHNTQTVTFEEDGSAIVEFRVDGLNEIMEWILSYGDQVQVLAPKTLRQKVIKIAQNTVKQNEQLLPV